MYPSPRSRKPRKPVSKTLHPELSEESKASLATLKRAGMALQGQISHEPHTAGPLGQSAAEQAAAGSRNMTHAHAATAAAAAAATPLERSASHSYRAAATAAPDDIDQVLAASLSNHAPVPPASYPAPAPGTYASADLGLVPPRHELYADATAAATQPGDLQG